MEIVSKFFYIILCQVKIPSIIVTLLTPKNAIYATLRGCEKNVEPQKAVRRCVSVNHIF
jgi:hypothetical protein